ncbi:hypothetical protein DYH55_11080 [Methylovirgula sp. 4M-Z18]|nr:hypothetical protein DYH55_11080 [Methylovirgula sp. 4M-Z18]
MSEKGTNQNAPVLIRTYKQEAEFEIWKMKSDGQYTLLKTYPMCRWSGQLGPKTREGDRQVPEGFYTITPGQMNPNSNYYLSFNVGYPNAYDRAHGASGGLIMVHGACSSAGCFSMTDRQIGEIYAIVREGFNGGQKAVQMQSYPFHMSAENLAKHRSDPNIAFWKQLKNGSDHFEVTKQEPSVGVCGKHYVFDATPAGGMDASSPCPDLRTNEEEEAAVAAKATRDDQQVAELVQRGVKAVEYVYSDGGQNPYFRDLHQDHGMEVSRTEALAAEPTEIVLDDSSKPQSPVVQVAANKTDAVIAAKETGGKPTTPSVAAPAPAPTPVVAVATTPAAPAQAPVMASATAYAPVDTVPAKAETPFYKRWLGLNDDTTSALPVPAQQPAATAEAPATAPVPTVTHKTAQLAAKPVAKAKPKLQKPAVVPQADKPQASLTRRKQPAGKMLAGGATTPTVAVGFNAQDAQ